MKTVNITIKGRLWQLYYQVVSESFSYTVELEENENVTDVISQLKEKTSQTAGVTFSQLNDHK